VPKMNTMIATTARDENSMTLAHGKGRWGWRIRVGRLPLPQPVTLEQALADEWISGDGRLGMGAFVDHERNEPTTSVRKCAAAILVEIQAVPVLRVAGSDAPRRVGAGSSAMK
jgi:hypothetical protein